MFKIPDQLKPRDKYMVKTASKSNGKGYWESTIVDIYERGKTKKIATYERHYEMLNTFEPFRQGDKDYALISMDYTKTAVLDLQTGKVIAEEGEECVNGEVLKGCGFCPVGFYVPDWWDIHDGSIDMNSEHWNKNWEWPVGDFGFVWGCYWGDDTSWKVQYLDLSRIQEGIIKREERFGYVELAISGWRSPCLWDIIEHTPTEPPSFIHIDGWSGRKSSVMLAVEKSYRLNTGKENK